MEKLAAIGVDEKEVNVRNKLSRGNHGGFSASMSISDRYSVAAPWIVLAIGLVLIAALGGTYFYSKGYQRAYEHHQVENEFARAAERAYGKCAAIGDVEKALRCYQESYEASADERRAEHDLNAQREMADWAEGMLWATGLIGFLTISITGLGVFWVRETLVETRKAVKAADDAVEVTRAIGQAQVRAYLTCTGGKFGIERSYFHCWCYIANKGQSPARNVRIRWQISTLYFLPGTTDPIRLDGIEMDRDVEAIAAGSNGRTSLFLTREQVGPDAHDALCSEFIANFNVNCRMTWEDVFGVEQSIKFTLSTLSPEIFAWEGDSLKREGQLESYSHDAS